MQWSYKKKQDFPLIFCILNNVDVQNFQWVFTLMQILECISFSFCFHIAHYANLYCKLRFVMHRGNVLSRGCKQYFNLLFPSLFFFVLFINLFEHGLFVVQFLKEVEKYVKARTKGEMGAAKSLCSPFDQPELPEGTTPYMFDVRVACSFNGMVFKTYQAEFDTAGG